MHYPERVYGSSLGFKRQTVPTLCHNPRSIWDTGFSRVKGRQQKSQPKAARESPRPAPPFSKVRRSRPERRAPPNFHPPVKPVRCPARSTAGGENHAAAAALGSSGSARPRAARPAPRTSPRPPPAARPPPARPPAHRCPPAGTAPRRRWGGQLPNCGERAPPRHAPPHLQPAPPQDARLVHAGAPPPSRRAAPPGHAGPPGARSASPQLPSADITPAPIGAAAARDRARCAPGNFGAQSGAAPQRPRRARGRSGTPEPQPRGTRFPFPAGWNGSRAITAPCEKPRPTGFPSAAAENSRREDGLSQGCRHRGQQVRLWPWACRPRASHQLSWPDWCKKNSSPSKTRCYFLKGYVWKHRFQGAKRQWEFSYLPRCWLNRSLIFIFFLPQRLSPYY